MSSSMQRQALRATTGDPYSRLAAAEELHNTLLMSQTESTGQFITIIPTILTTISQCTIPLSNDIDTQIISKCLDNLLITLDADSSVRRTLAVPTSLKILMYAQQLINDEDTIRKYIKIIHKITENHAQSILRSTILNNINNWLDTGLVIGDDKVSNYSKIE